MAIYHCSCKMISRGQGRSAVGAAAYRSGEKLTNEYDGLTHDYTKKSGVVYSEIMLCENAPQEYKDRATLWNAVERAEKSGTAQLAREYEVALPVELTREEQIELVQKFAKENFTDKGMCVDFSIHDKEDGNPHAHIMLTTRPIEKDGSWGAKATNEYVLDKNGNRILQKLDKQNRKIYKRVKIDTTDWNTKDFLNSTRESWAAKINAELEKKNIPQRVDHRSFKAQGKEQIPTQHIGVSATAMEKRGIESNRGNENREIREANKQLQTLSYVEKSLQKTIAEIKEDISWNTRHEQIAQLEKLIPKCAGKEKTLLKIQRGLLEVYEKAQLVKPTKTSEGRTVEYNGQSVSYFEYHRTKYIRDISYLQGKVKTALETLEQSRQNPTPKAEQPKPQEQGGFAARREAIIGKAQPQEVPKIDTAYVERAARELAAVRNEFVRARVQSQERTSYQPNPIYERQANEIATLTKTIAEQKHTIETFKAEQSKLGMFKGKDKKELQRKIDNFERLRRDNEEKLAALGVKDPAGAEQAIKEKRMLAAVEQDKARAARENVGATERAEEAKAVFLKVVEQIPADQRQAVLASMEQYTEKTEVGTVSGRLELFQAQAEARRQLDGALKDQPQGREHSKYKMKGFDHE